MKSQSLFSDVKKNEKPWDKSEIWEIHKSLQTI